MPFITVPPFQPADGGTVNIASTSTTSSTPLKLSANWNDWQQVRIFNPGAVTKFVKFGGDNTVTATQTADYPVAAGAIEVVTVGPQSTGNLYAAAVSASSDSSALYFSVGTGN